MRFNQKNTDNHSELLGINLKILSGISFSLMYGFIKYLNNDIPLGQVVFFRSIVALLPLILFLILTSDFPSALYTHHPWQHVKRCLLGTLAMFAAFAALHYLPLAEAMAISYLSPVFIVIMAMYFFKEKINVSRLLGVILGITGLLIMTVPNFSAHADNRTLLGIALSLTFSYTDCRCTVAGTSIIENR